MKAKLEAGESVALQVAGQSVEIKAGYVDIKKEPVKKTGR